MSLSPAVEIGRALLRSALDVNAGGDVCDVVEAFGAEVETERFRAWCRHQGVTPTVARQLGRLDGLQARRLHGALAADAKSVAGAALFQAGALREILSALADAGVPVIPLKGIGLDIRCYGGPGRRKDGDHDLLVPRDWVVDAAAILQSLGYRPASHPARPEAWQRSTKHHSPPLVRHQGPMPVGVELHWTIASKSDGFGFRDPVALTEALWTRSAPGTLLGVPMRTLAPVDEVLYLCLHTVKHLAQHGVGLTVRLAMLEDLARLLHTAGPVDWADVQARADALNAVHVLGPIRALWTRGLGAPQGTLLPDDLDVPPWPDSAWGTWIVTKALLAGDGAMPGGPPVRHHREKARRILVHALLLRRPRDRWRVVRTHLLAPLLQPTAADRRHLPDGVPGWLALPARWGRLATRLFSR